MTCSAETDRTLTAITAHVDDALKATRTVYDLVRAAKKLGYSYPELERATGFARGTLQNIIDGRNPRLTVEHG
ncbi:MAG: hypothetical protein HYZ39_14050 [Mycolicibacterium cosmeticum]|nr:hypothetical protein [Mycolicibacterium cosmeticum]